MQQAVHAQKITQGFYKRMLIKFNRLKLNLNRRLRSGTYLRKFYLAYMSVKEDSLYQNVE